MKDRVPANPGRVLITPETGAAAFYATMTRADNPTQEGTPLNKGSLLKDATASMFGLDANAVPDEVFALLKTLVDNAQNSADSKAKIEKLNYIGTGVVGESAPTSVTFSFVPKIVFLSLLTNNGSSLSNYVHCALLIPSTGRGAFFYDQSFVRLYVSLNEKTVSWYSGSSNVDEQLNRSGWEYEAYAIG